MRGSASNRATCNFTFRVKGERADTADKEKRAELVTDNSDKRVNLSSSCKRYAHARIAPLLIILRNSRKVVDARDNQLSATHEERGVLRIGEVR